MCIGFFTAWSPYAFVSIWAAFGDIDVIPPLAFAVPAMFSKSSTIYNPLIYLLLKPNFRHLLCKDMLTLRQVCVRGCLAVCVPQDSCRPALALGQHSVRPRGHLTTVSLAHCPCEKCNDPFEQFRNYPRRCPISVSTVQFSMQDSGEPEADLELDPEAGIRHESSAEAKKPVQVLVKRRKSSEIDSLEITLEMVSARAKVAKGARKSWAGLRVGAFSLCLC